MFYPSRGFLLKITIHVEYLAKPLRFKRVELEMLSVVKNVLFGAIACDVVEPVWDVVNNAQIQPLLLGL